MRKSLLSLLLVLFTLQYNLLSQEAQVAEVYFLTCGPGTETYSVYGHSALRIINHSDSTDLVYNWGVFDFSTPNFAWRFAKGRLDYMLGVYPYDRFLQDYFYEKRWVISQKVNLSPEELNILFGLLAENLKPENISYRYDFFYDDCSTRIRDLLEKSVADKIIWPTLEPGKKLPTFREKTAEYQKGYSWMKYGVDLIMGSPGDKKASFRDQMFLPVDLMNGLSELIINRNQEMVPLLQSPVTVLDFDSPVVREKMLISPPFVFTYFLIIIIILSNIVKTKGGNLIIDIFIFTVFSVLAILMIFFNFFTDHQQMKWNLNIIWLSPFIIGCLVSLLSGKNWKNWFRITLYLAAFFLATIIFLPQEINNANIPLIITLIFRSSVRSQFGWNPLTIHDLT